MLQSGEKLIPSLSRFLGRRIGAARALTRIALLLVLFAGCAPETNPVRGLEIRMHIDRPQARVGDALGVTIEIDTPPGFSVGRPDPPTAAGAFVTEAIEMVESLDLEGGLRHRVLWTLRAKWVGEQVLPLLQIPLIHPEGRIEPLPVGGVPFAVVSVRAELPEREVYFDLRDPEPARGSRAPWVAGGLIAAILSAVLAAAWWRRRHGVLGAIPDPRVLAASALAALEAGDEIAELRPRADHFSDTMRHYVAQRWSLHGQALTPSELGEPVAVGLVELLQRLDAERFATAPEVREIERSGAEARAWFRDAVGS